MNDSKEFGVARIALIPMRIEASDKSEMISQLLFGETYQVLERLEKWVLIRNDFDDYEGYIDINQFHRIETSYYEQILNSEFKICTDLFSKILYKKKNLNIPIGSILPITSTELFEMAEQFAFIGESKNSGEKYNFEQLKNISLKYLNTPYLWGGKGPLGIDCSGFVQQVFKISGYSLYRDAWQQYSQGEKIDKLNASQPGDVAFFENEHKKISHVGIILDENQIIHASGYVRLDKLDEKGIFNIQTELHTHKLAGIKRFIRT